MLTSFLRLLAALGAAALLASCASVDPKVYAGEKPTLDLRRYFDGLIEGHGMVTDRSGQVTRRFVVTIRASWQGEAGRDLVGTLDEDFVWSDGVKEKRIWTLRPGAAPGQWIGTAADVLGQANGVVSGNALNWTYTLAYKTADGKTFNIAFDDWMFLIDERVMLNRAVMTFWGWRVGEVLISFTRK
jgi:hypothetical protein